MSARSPLGQVVLLKMPVMIGDSLRSFYANFIEYGEKICFASTDAEYPNIIVSIELDNTITQQLIKNYVEGVEEISVSELEDEEYNLIGNKLLWPSR